MPTDPVKVETPQGYMDRIIRESQARTEANLDKTVKALKGDE